MSKNYRLFKVAKELNVGTSVLVDKLAQEGISIENSPNAKISGDMYNLLLQEFATDKRLREKAKEMILDERNTMVLLDEINIAIRYGYVDAGEVVGFLKAEKPPMTHVVLTGRNADDAIVEAADMVTEMELIKHPFRAGIKAQIGVEF